MTDAPKMPAFPEKLPRAGVSVDAALDYWEQLAAAWEARARLLHAGYETIRSWREPHMSDQLADRVLLECGPLPPKEET